ncbi:MAG: RNA polymerase sigma factor [Longimicrobiales bacterium]
MKEPTLEAVLDEYLVTASRSGDRKAMHVLVRRWNPRLARFALRFVNDPDSARDVVQEAWIGIMRGLPRLKDPGRFRSWAYSIVANKARDWGRRQSRRSRALDALSAEGEASRGARSKATVQPGDTAVATVREALAEVKEEQRALLVLVYVDGLTIREVSHILQIPEGTVKSRLHHARSAVRARIESNSRESRATEEQAK